MGVIDVFRSIDVSSPTRAPAIVALKNGILLAFAASFCDQNSPLGKCDFDAKAIKPTNWISRSEDHDISWSTPTKIPVPDGYDVPTPIYTRRPRRCT